MTGSWPGRTFLVAVAAFATATAVLVAGGSDAAIAAPGGPRIDVITPADQTHIPPDGTVPVEVVLNHPLNPSTFRASLTTGAPPVTSDVTSLFTVAGSTATGTLTSAHLQPGISELTLSAQPGNGSPNRPPDAGRKEVSVSFSWEPDVDLSTADRCDFLAARTCLLPFPNDYFTIADPSTDTGLRLDIHSESMPTNAGGPSDPSEYNRNDGFSPAPKILAFVPGIDLAETGAPPITDIEQSLEADAPTMLIDADTGERMLQWTELDVQATDPNSRALIMRPAENLVDGHRYIVALRDLEDAAGQPIEASRAFRLYRDDLPTFAPQIEARRGHMDELFATLEDAGVPRGDLFLAWDFTVASTRNLSERLLHMRDDAFASLDGDAPTFAVSNVQENVNARVARRITGTFQVPMYLEGTGGSGSRQTRGPDGLPFQNGFFTADFTCIVPQSTMGANPPTSVTPGRLLIFGHGMLGNHTATANDRNQIVADTHNFVTCGTSWTGLSGNSDAIFVAQALGNLTLFPRLPDRVQQGFLNFLFLGRLMKHENGFVSDPAFRSADGGAGVPLIDRSDLFYNGHSQGAFLGVGLQAFAEDWTRAVLSAPSQTFSMQRRNVVWPQFAPLFNAAYPDEIDRALVMSFFQIAMDRIEGGGVGHHITSDPYPGSSTKKVIFHMAFGDFQAVNVSTEVLARTLGLSIHQPALPDGVHADVNPYFGIPAIPQYPFDGSAFIVFYSGNPHPPTTNTWPFSPTFGSDPHSRPLNNANAQLQLSEFLETNGAVIDICGATHCVA